MMTSCEVARGVTQTSLAATSLPLELIQHVFSYLDMSSSYAARKVCRYWQFASTDAVPLARQLRKLPILPRVEAAGSTLAELLNLYEEAAQSLLFSVRSDRQWDEPGSLSRALKMGFNVGSRIAATRNGSRTVLLNGYRIELYDTSGEWPVCVAQRCLQDLNETVGDGPRSRTQPNSYNELALSSCGNLLAIARERRIQIYDLTAEPDSFTVKESVPAATGHYICGLEFEQNDHVLRVRLSGKGNVLYLGTPPGSAQEGQKATFQHWKGRKGLSNTFLDSSLLTIAPTSGDVTKITRLSGLQLLYPFEGGYVFAGQRHGGGESSHYFLGHVQTSIPDNWEASKVEYESVNMLARLESFLSSFDYDQGQSGFTSWENMPSAHEHHPRFAMTQQGCFIAVAERDKKRIRQAPLTQLFVYRTPNEKQIRAALAEKWALGKTGVSDVLESSLDKLEGPRQVCFEDKLPGDVSVKYTVPRLPICLSSIQGDIEHLDFAPAGVKAYKVSAATVETSRSWRLEEW